MNRRQFLKISSLAALLGIATPRRAAASLARAAEPARRCRITVVRRHCFTDLQSRYLDNPEEGPCPLFKAGDSFTLSISTIDNSVHAPENFCPKAWTVLAPHIAAHLSATQATGICGIAPVDKSIIAACPDGTRPVIFKITPL